MSSGAQSPPWDNDDEDPWELVADYRPILEQIVAEDGPFAEYAERLLAELDSRDDTTEGMDS
jgi:hypothetical protein